LARWEATEAALVFASGYAANVAVVSSLAGADDVVFSDELNHASLIDGCRLARARVRIYRHADCNHLEELLQTDRGTSRRRWIVSDSLFSMDGDAAPLADLLDLAERHDAGLILDEAHATGVLGPLGRGLTDLLPPGRDTARLIKIGTLSKALGSQGGFVCGTRELIDWLVNHARPYIFSTALAPPAAAAALRSIRLVQTEPHRRRDLLASADRLREGLRALGLDVGRSTTQIVPILVGPPEPTLALSQRLQEAGMLVPAIRPPSVPPGSSRLRLSLTAGHGEAIEPLLQAIARQL
jgi:8-amino-7-oxononanoate synthase